MRVLTPEKVFKNSADVALVFSQFLLERIFLAVVVINAKSHFSSQNGQPVCIGGQLVGLEAVSHLDAVFDVPEKDICLGQPLAIIDGLQSESLDDGKGTKRIRRPEKALLSAVNQLKGLDDEFDFADAALAELDVQVFPPARGQFAVDPVLDSADFIESAHVQGLPVNKRANHSMEGLTQEF